MPTAFEQQTILLVDDEASSRVIVSRMLRRLGFAEVLVAEDGYQAIEFLNVRPNISAVLTDFRMPGLHGLQLLKMIRTGQTGAPRNLACALLTSYAERHLVGLAIVLDVDTFLAKPASVETLSKHLSRCFQYRFEPLSVDNYGAVDVDNAAPHLTGGAFQARGGPAPVEPEPLMEAPSTPPPPTPALEVKPAPVPRPAPPPAPAQAGDGTRKVKLSEVPEDAVLARDLYGAGGTLLLAAGTRFKSRYAKRLEELGSIREKVEHVWIVDEPTA